MVEVEREQTVGGAEGSRSVVLVSIPDAPLHGSGATVVAAPGSARGHGHRMKKSGGEEKKGWRKGMTCGAVY
jgi:hypothetical protein